VYSAEVTELEKILAALANSGAAYLVVGGVAVVVHGHLRLTADLDLAIRLDRDNIMRVLSALESLDFQPRAPVAARDFADADRRAEWIRDKNLVVFSLWSPRFPATEVDLFVRNPFDFDLAYARAHKADLGGTTVTVASLEDLIALKREVGRPRDLADVEELEKILRRTGGKS
jgi:hypothetical protein